MERALSVGDKPGMVEKAQIRTRSTKVEPWTKENSTKTNSNLARNTITTDLCLEALMRLTIGKRLPKSVGFCKPSCS